VLFHFVKGFIHAWRGLAKKALKQREYLASDVVKNLATVYGGHLDQETDPLRLDNVGMIPKKPMWKNSPPGIPTFCSLLCDRTVVIAVFSRLGRTESFTKWRLKLGERRDI